MTTQSTQESLNVVLLHHVRAMRKMFGFDNRTAQGALDWILILIGADILPADGVMPIRTVEKGVSRFVLVAHPDGRPKLLGCSVCPSTFKKEDGFPEGWSFGVFPDSYVPALPSLRALSPAALVCPVCAAKWPDRVRMIDRASEILAAKEKLAAEREQAAKEDKS